MIDGPMFALCRGEQRRPDDQGGSTYSFAHVRFLVACLWVQPLLTLSVPCDIFRTPARIWGRFIDSGNQVGRTRSDIQAAGPRRCQSQIVLLLLGCKAGLICSNLAKANHPENIPISVG